MRFRIYFFSIKYGDIKFSPYIRLYGKYTPNVQDFDNILGVQKGKK